jgi:hypothetical protein
MEEQVTGLDRLIVAAVAMLIAAFALTAVTAFVPFAQADDQLAGKRDAGDVAIAGEDDDDDDDGDTGDTGNTRTGTTQGTGASNTNTRDTNTGTKTRNT